MGVSSYFEFVTTLFAWVMYDNLWQVLNDSGIVYLPILAMVLGHIIDSRKGGDDEGSAPIQSLKKIETDFAVMMVVIVLAAIPMVDIKLGEMQYTRPALNCAMAAKVVAGGSSTGTTLDHTLTTFGGQVGRAPLWWAFLHILSKSITSASIAAIPCSYDISSISVKMSNEKIKDPMVAKEVEEFFRDCYTAASGKYMEGFTSGLTEEQEAKMTWIGSPYFLKTSGYYDSLYSRNARSDWAFDPVRDRGFEDDKTASGNGGHPTCKQWWENSSIGLKAKLMNGVDPALVTEMTAPNGLLAKVASFGGKSLTRAERDDMFLRKYLSINSSSGSALVSSNAATSYHVGIVEKHSANLIAEAENPNRSALGTLGSAVSAVGGITGDIANELIAKSAIGIGGLLGLPAAVAEGRVIREGVSIFQGIIILMMVVLLPFMLVVSQYKLSTVMTLSVIMFGLHFLSFIWAIAFWADNNLMMALTKNGGAAGLFTMIENPTQAFIIVWMSRFFYVYFPLLFIAMMGWAGYQFGQLGKDMMGQVTQSTAPAKQGGGVITQLATKGATKGGGK